MALPIFLRINTLTPWLAKQGAKRGDFIVDRLKEPHRYILAKTLPGAGETTGHLLEAIADGHVEQTEEIIPPQSSYPPLRLVSGEDRTPP